MLFHSLSDVAGRDIHPNGDNVVKRGGENRPRSATLDPAMEPVARFDD
jgi:hypothetical protein